MRAIDRLRVWIWRVGLCFAIVTFPLGAVALILGRLGRLGPVEIAMVAGVAGFVVATSPRLIVWRLVRQTRGSHVARR